MDYYVFTANSLAARFELEECRAIRQRSRHRNRQSGSAALSKVGSTNSQRCFCPLVFLFLVPFPWTLRETGLRILRIFMSISSLFVSVHALVVFVLFTFFASSQATAAIIADFDIGIGSNLASVQIDQEDGYGYLFRVRWDGDNFTSWDALIEIDSAMPTLSMTYDTYSWGIFLTGITIDGDTNYGQGDLYPIENYWHFWLRDSGSWDQAMFGASDRVLFNGASDAWVFGSSITPQSVPAPGAIALTLFSIAVCPRRRRSNHTKASLAH